MLDFEGFVESERVKHAHKRHWRYGIVCKTKYRGMISFRYPRRFILRLAHSRRRSPDIQHRISQFQFDENVLATVLIVMPWFILLHVDR